MLPHPNIAIRGGQLYRFKKAPVRAVLLSLPKVKIEFSNGKQIWVDGRVLSDF